MLNLTIDFFRRNAAHADIAMPAKSRAQRVKELRESIPLGLQNPALAAFEAGIKAHKDSVAWNRDVIIPDWIRACDSEIVVDGFMAGIEYAAAH